MEIGDVFGQDNRCISVGVNCNEYGNDVARLVAQPIHNLRYIAKRCRTDVRAECITENHQPEASPEVVFVDVAAIVVD